MQRGNRNRGIQLARGFCSGDVLADSQQAGICATRWAWNEAIVRVAQWVIDKCLETGSYRGFQQAVDAHLGLRWCICEPGPDISRDVPGRAEAEGGERGIFPRCLRCGR